MPISASSDFVLRSLIFLTNAWVFWKGTCAAFVVSTSLPAAPMLRHDRPAAQGTFCFAPLLCKITENVV